MALARNIGTSVALLGALIVSACSSQESEPISGDDSTASQQGVPAADGPKLVATSLATAIYAKPGDPESKIGYLRVGGTVARSQQPVSREGCEEGWYAIRPAGFVCVGKDASLALDHPVARALGKLPDLSKPLPYRYGFVRAIAPNYLRIPTKQEQAQYEFQLDRHLRSYHKLKNKWNERKVGANDVPLDPKGVAIGRPPAQVTTISDNELFGGDGNEMVPWWLDGGRKIPHLSGYKAPAYAVIASRVRRFTGLALIGTFVPGEDSGHRRMVVTTDGRLVPASKLKPNDGSTWHGIPLGPRSGIDLPMGFVTAPKGAVVYGLDGGTRVEGKLAWRSPVNLTGKVRMRNKVRYVELKSGQWVASADMATAALPSTLPSFAKGQQKWIDVGIVNQILLAYEGNRAVYATLVATGRDGLADPKDSHATVQGTFRIREKHVTTTMDSHEVDNQFELRDVPWVQYFKGGYALHAAYWHDDYGKPRSHGCINMSPIDAHWLFFWTGPDLPQNWHGVYASDGTGEGTIVHVRP